MRAALIGIGFWGAQLAQAVARADGIELACVYARDADARAAFGERFGVPAAATFDDALESADAVLLATPNAVHEEQALAAAARGRHVFVEKPIAQSLAAGERMREACASAGATLLVGHEFRRLGASRKAKELVDAGALGTVVLAEANLSLPSPVKPGTWKAAGHGTPLVQLGIHHADTLAYLLGPVARATGRYARVVSEFVDDVGVATLELESGALASIASSYVSPKTYAIRVLGTEAVLDIRTDISVWPAAHELDARTTMTLAGEPVAFEGRDPLVEQLEELARRGAVETGADEGLAALRVILEAIGEEEA